MTQTSENIMLVFKIKISFLERRFKYDGIDVGNSHRGND